MLKSKAAAKRPYSVHLCIKVNSSFFLISLLGKGRNGVAGSVYRIADSLLIEILLGEDNRLTLAVRGSDLFHGNALQTASLTWLSHMPHIMPSTPRVIFNMGVMFLWYPS